MNLNNFTLKAQESVHKAFSIAESKGQQAVECAHILKGIMSEAEAIVSFIFSKMGVNSSAVADAVRRSRAGLQSTAMIHKQVPDP